MWTFQRFTAKFLLAVGVVVIVLAIFVVSVSGTTFNFEGEDYCAEHRAWSNGPWLGQFHPWHQQHYINVFGREGACPNWANDQRNSAVNGLRDLGYFVREPGAGTGQKEGSGRVIDPGTVSTADELLALTSDAIVRVTHWRGAGTGFIFAIEETTAFVATNHHVIDRADAVDVQVADGKTYKALTLGWDADRDVAVLAICCSYDFAALSWESADPKVGEDVVAIGFPRSSIGGLTATTGAVTEHDSISREHGFFAHSAPLNPGNSGGPLFSVPGGKVLGINTARGLEKLSFYSVPYQSIAESIKEWRSQLVIAPAPPRRDSTAHPPVEFEGSSYRVHEFRDPISGEVPVGKRLVAADVTQTALRDDVSYHVWNFQLQDAAGYVYDSESFRSDIDVEPRFSSGSLSQGMRVRGWLIFEIPASAVPASILVEQFLGGTAVIADLS